jgi:hypothetical protein
LGTIFDLADSENILTPFGWILTASLYFTAFINIIATAFFIRYDNDDLLIRSMKKCMNSISDKKYETLIGRIDEFNEKTAKKPAVPKIISDPKKQLEELRVQLRECLNEVTKEELKKNDITVNIILRCSYDTDWTCIGFYNCPPASREKILSSDKSTFHEALISPDGYAWYNDKNEAFRLGKYCSDCDELKGSIYCRRIVLSTKRDSAICVVCVSTSDNLAKVGNIMEEDMVFENLQYIMKDFEKQIQIELALYYISGYKEQPARKEALKHSI